ncbi:MAG: hypothetical protein ABIO39_12370, partial [Caulobacteraceae bacterium]
GYSTGRWQGSTLVVDTRDISWRFFDSNGVPQGSAVSIVERFTPSADGSKLSYTFKVTDPETFKQPVELKRAWLRRQGEAVRPYNCKVGNRRASR